MSVDDRITLALETSLSTIAPPETPLGEIRRRMALEPLPIAGARRSRMTASLVAAAAVIAILVFALPSLAPALTGGLEARYRDALHALGGYAPPPPPAAIEHSLTPTTSSLDSARGRVAFTLVAPAGLPTGIVSERISTAPTGVYDKAKGTWKMGPPIVEFSYRRTGGQLFVLTAERFDAKTEPGPKFVFEALDPAPDRRAVLVQRRNFAWRNGDQLMSTTDAGISDSEIAAIRLAMHGTDLPERDVRFRANGSFAKVRIAAP